MISWLVLIYATAQAALCISYNAVRYVFVTLQQDIILCYSLYVYIRTLDMFSITIIYPRTPKWNALMSVLSVRRS